MKNVRVGTGNQDTDGDANSNGVRQDVSLTFQNETGNNTNPESLVIGSPSALSGPPASAGIFSVQGENPAKVSTGPVATSWTLAFIILVFVFLE